jgi:homoserine kinase
MPSHPAISEVTVRVRVAGTTSNLGPGFDCLGVALGLHNTVDASWAGSDGISHPMADEAVRRFHEATGLPSSRPLRWSLTGEVPVSRGLGSSVTLRLGILAALNVLHGEPLGRDDLFTLCAALEGHPDNAGPAVYGGFFVGAPNGSRFRFPVDEGLRFVLLIRAREVRTEEARRVLPAQIPFADAVANVGRAAAIAAAFASRDYGSLRGLMRDRLHEPFREALNPGLQRIVAAGEAAGALGGFLSGSGSTVACVAGDAETAGNVAAAMRDACVDDAAPPETRIVGAENEGVTWTTRQA